MKIKACCTHNLTTAPELIGGVEETSGNLKRDAIWVKSHKQVNTQEHPPAKFSAERMAELFENAVSSAFELYRGETLYEILHYSFGLTIQEIRSHGYLTDRELMKNCQLPRRVLKGDATVRDILDLDTLPKYASLAHKDSAFWVPVEDMKKLTDSGREDFAALLDARIADVRMNARIPELLLEGVEAAELERFCVELEAHEQAEQAMGPAMG